MSAAEVDPITLQVLSGGLRAICDEMGAVLIRSAHSPNIKERRDCSTALFDARGELCLLYTSPSPRDGLLSRMPSSA